MAGRTYSAEAIVLGKTKLRESDLILRMLSSDGSLLEAIAKGARKPTSVSSARLELFNRVELLLAEARGLDIVKETRLLEARTTAMLDPSRASSASVVCELASKVAQPGLCVSRLYDLTAKELSVIDQSAAECLPALTAAYIIKASAMVGSRPSFVECVVCGKRCIDVDEDAVRVSLIDGGVVCSDCSSQSECELMPQPLISWAQHLLRSRLEDIALDDACAKAGTDLLQLSDRWVQVQFGFRLKSIGSLLRYCAENAITIN